MKKMISGDQKKFKIQLKINLDWARNTFKINKNISNSRIYNIVFDKSN